MYKVRVCVLSCVRLFVIPQTVAHQTPLSMGFSQQEYWSELPCPPPGDFPDPGIEPISPALAGRFLTTEPPGNPCAKFKGWQFKCSGHSDPGLSTSPSLWEVVGEHSLDLDYMVALNTGSQPRIRLFLSQTLQVSPSFSPSFRLTLGVNESGIFEGLNSNMCYFLQGKDFIVLLL